MVSERQSVVRKFVLFVAKIFIHSSGKLSACPEPVEGAGCGALLLMDNSLQTVSLFAQMGSLRYTPPVCCFLVGDRQKQTRDALIPGFFWLHLRLQTGIVHYVSHQINIQAHDYFQEKQTKMILRTCSHPSGCVVIRLR